MESVAEILAFMFIHSGPFPALAMKAAAEASDALSWLDAHAELSSPVPRHDLRRARTDPKRPLYHAPLNTGAPRRPVTNFARTPAPNAPGPSPQARPWVGDMRARRTKER